MQICNELAEEDVALLEEAEDPWENKVRGVHFIAHCSSQKTL